VTDFGIRSYDLAYAMMDGYDVTVLLDATPQGLPPGTVSLIEPDVSGLGAGAGETIDAHGMNPVRVLQMIHSLGGHPEHLYLIGCEPAVLEADEFGLSAPVEAAIPLAIEMLQSLLRDLLHNHQAANHALVERG
jgi:hydrogenase maturation protease